MSDAGSAAAAVRLREVERALRIVLGDPSPFEVRPDEHRAVIMVRERAEGSSFGLHVDRSDPEEDDRARLLRDIDDVIDGCCESRALWGRRLPECPLHPDSHPLDIGIGDDAVTLICPVTCTVVRTVQLD